MADEPAGVEGWGLVPQTVLDAMRALNAKIMRSSRHLDGLVWPDKPRDVNDLLRMSVSDSHKAARASTDLRSLLTVYAHRYHQPRPVMAELARAQESSPQGIPGRYRQAHVAAVAELLSSEPEVELILHGFPSLALADLAEFAAPVGDAARRLVEAGERPRTATQRSRDEQASRRAQRTAELSKLVAKTSRPRK